MAVNEQSEIHCSPLFQRLSLEILTHELQVGHADLCAAPENNILRVRDAKNASLAKLKPL